MVGLSQANSTILNQYRVSSSEIQLQFWLFSNFDQNSVILCIYGEIFTKFGEIIAKSSKILVKSSEFPSNMADLPQLVHATKFEPIWTDPIIRTP